jgi:prepilin-type N-terminal cleavage/methylation domain-containing protein
MARSVCGQRRGVTLIELLVTILILSVVFTITTLSLAGEKHSVGSIPSIPVRIRALRSSAIESGTPQTAVLSDTDDAVFVTALPDGRVVSDMPNLDRNAGLVRSVHAQ